MWLLFFIHPDAGQTAGTVGRFLADDRTLVFMKEQIRYGTLIERVIRRIIEASGTGEH